MNNTKAYNTKSEALPSPSLMQKQPLLVLWCDSICVSSVLHISFLSRYD